MKFPVKVQLPNSVIPTRSLTCLMLNAENMRHFTSLKAFEKSDILHTFAIQKHVQNGNNTTCAGWVKQLPKPLLFYCPYNMLGKKNDIMDETALITEAVSCILHAYK